jgi:hypothetical protein
MGNIKFIKSRKIKTLLSTKHNQEAVEFTEVTDEKNLAEYHETLYAEKRKPDSYNSRSLIYRDLSGIEENVDTIQRSSNKTVEVESDLEKKVDVLLSKHPVNKIKRKPANVIYVVSKPKPGQVKGDWAVRSHGKIFSHHRTKLAAIKKAREIARIREATVLIQNVDGTFSEGFKPRPK